MKANDRIEELLNRAHNTIQDLRPCDEFLGEDDALTAYLKTAYLEVYGQELADDTPINLYVAVGNATAFGLHLAEVIERLSWALENTLNRYEQALDRLGDLNDYEFIEELEGGSEDECVSEQCGRDCGCCDCAPHVEEELDA